MRFFDSLFNDILSFYNVFFLGLFIVPVVIVYAFKQLIFLPVKDNEEEVDENVL